MKIKGYIILLVISMLLFLNKDYYNYLKDFEYYEATITLISIITAFNITSIALLYNAQHILGKLYEKKDKPPYFNKLNRLKFMFKNSFILSIFSVLFLLLFPDSLYIKYFTIQKFWFISSIVFFNCYSWFKILDIILYVFSLPPNTPRSK